MNNIDNKELFKDIDLALMGLGMSYSSIEYADFIRQEFDNVVQSINKLKIESGNIKLTNKSDWYFQK